MDNVFRFQGVVGPPDPVFSVAGEPSFSVGHGVAARVCRSSLRRVRSGMNPRFRWRAVAEMASSRYGPPPGFPGNSGLPLAVKIDAFYSTVPVERSPEARPDRFRTQISLIGRRGDSRFPLVKQALVVASRQENCRCCTSRRLNQARIPQPATR